MGLAEKRPHGRSLGFTIIHSLLKQLRAKRTDDPAAAPAFGIQQPVQTLIRIGLPPAP